MSDDLIVELLKEVRNEQTDQTIILRDLKKDVEINTKDLTEHKEGVIQNRSRIEKLELPLLQRLTAAKLIKGFIGIGAIAGAAFAIMKFL